MIILFSFLSVQETYSQFVLLFLRLVPFKWTLFPTSIYFPFSIYCFQSFPFIASCRTCPLIFFALSQSFSLDQNLPVSVFLYYFIHPHLILSVTLLSLFFIYTHIVFFTPPYILFSLSPILVIYTFITVSLHPYLIPSFLFLHFFLLTSSFLLFYTLHLIPSLFTPPLLCFTPSTIFNLFFHFFLLTPSILLFYTLRLIPSLFTPSLLFCTLHHIQSFLFRHFSLLTPSFLLFYTLHHIPSLHFFIYTSITLCFTPIPYSLFHFCHVFTLSLLLFYTLHLTRFYIIYFSFKPHYYLLTLSIFTLSFYLFTFSLLLSFIFLPHFILSLSS
ncbi:unnamed protein product [Acanthosepion pharaonis]|uniref:Uncharacterized protein n=1 Tax=Acanthosepion pharaonis TaxID=158019 RepID=A0A812DTI6_ACAPH|nr:unnamed protein product [Sepia pharaonis]